MYDPIRVFWGDPHDVNLCANVCSRVCAHKACPTRCRKNTYNTALILAAHCEATCFWVFFFQYSGDLNVIKVHTEGGGAFHFHPECENLGSGKAFKIICFNWVR